MRWTCSIVAFALVTLVIVAAGGTASAEPPMGPVEIAAANPGDQFTPAVAWDDEHKRWLAVWEQDVSGVRWIVGRLISNNGSPLGDSFFISDAATDQTAPDVVYDPGHDRYLVTYERFEGAAEEDVYAASVSYSGTVFSPDLGIAGYPPEENQIDVTACGDSWMVVWKNGQGAAGQVYARPVAGDLALGTSTNVSVPYFGASWPAVDCIPHGIGFFLVWEQDFTTGLDGVAGAFVAGDGTLGDKFNVLGSSTIETRNFTRPAVSFGDFHNRAYVIWETDRDDLVHHDLAGRWVEIALFADDFETGNTSRWSVTTP